MSKTLLILTFALMLMPFSFSVSQAESERATIAQAERLFLTGNYEKVIYEADRLSSLRPAQKDELLFIKGLSQLKLDRFKDARESLGDIALQSPRSKHALDAYVAIGDSYFLEGDIDKALKTYQDVVNRYPDNKNISLIFYKIGNCFKEKGLDDRASEHFDKVKRLSPYSFESKMIEGYNPSRISSVKMSDWFSVQVGSFKSRGNADRYADKLSKQGLDSFVEIPVSSGDQLYRVKIGKYRSKEEAKSAALKLNRLGHSPKICTRTVYE